MSRQEARKKVAVVIPIYKNTLDAHEAIALEQCFKVLGNYPVIAIKPNHLVLPEQIMAYSFADVISFENAFFKDIAGYNALTLSDTFYKAFLDYEFMLIYQLDAFVFKDELTYWCGLDYDYIGAPWLKDCEHPDFVKAVKSNIKYFFHTRYDVYTNGEPSRYQFENKVGNGGFSLRRVRKFYDLCLSMRPVIEKYLEQGISSHFNEDRFWSIEVNRKRKNLKIPYYKTAVKFSFDNAPERAMSITGNQLPFGCHGWCRQLDFWRPVFSKINYTI